MQKLHLSTAASDFAGFLSTLLGAALILGLASCGSGEQTPGGVPGGASGGKDAGAAGQWSGGTSTGGVSTSGASGGAGGSAKGGTSGANAAAAAGGAAKPGDAAAGRASTGGSSDNGGGPSATEVKGSTEPIGMAVFPDDGVETTTGGGDGEVVTATSAAELAQFATSTDPLYIIVKGSISGGGEIKVESNKTIIGADSGATLTGVQFSVNGKQNIIFRNLTMSKATDAIATRGSHHVWIDHLDVSACGDGLIDITKESDYHTVSWTRFSKHHKTMLLNSGTSQPADDDDLNTTVHHNWFDGSDTRNPRAAYGDIHVFNNMYNDNGYGIGLHSRCMVLSEHNHFLNVTDPIKQMYRPDPTDIHHGFAKDVGSIFENIKGAKDNEDALMTVNFREQYYMYDFALDSAKDVQAFVKAHVGPGPEYSTLGPLPIPGNGTIKVATNKTLRWTRGHSATSYQVSFGTTNPPPVVTTTAEQTYAPGELSSATVYYWQVDQVTPTGTKPGNVWRFRTQ